MKVKSRPKAIVRCDTIPVGFSSIPSSPVHILAGTAGKHENLMRKPWRFEALCMRSLSFNRVIEQQQCRLAITSAAALRLIMNAFESGAKLSDNFDMQNESN